MATIPLPSPIVFSPVPPKSQYTIGGLDAMMPATANTSHNLYQLRSDKRTDAFHIHFTFYHDNQPPSLWMDIEQHIYD